MDTPVLLAHTVPRYREPVLSVQHDHYGDWIFSDGVSGTPEHPEPACLGCVIGGDPSLATLADLPSGWMAFRILPELEWERMPLPPPKSRLTGSWL